jgi:hypothetical protein
MGTEALRFDKRKRALDSTELVRPDLQLLTDPGVGFDAAHEVVPSLPHDVDEQEVVIVEGLTCAHRRVAILT